MRKVNLSLHHLAQLTTFCLALSALSEKKVTQVAILEHSFLIQLLDYFILIFYISSGLFLKYYIRLFILLFFKSSFSF
jgi:hypothetical protein